MNKNHKEYIEMIVNKWRPTLKTESVKKLTDERKEILAMLLENAEREIEEWNMKRIFIPLTVDVFLNIEKKIENMSAMVGPVDVTEEGVHLLARTRRMAKFEVEIDKSITGLNVDAELVQVLSRHICAEILAEVKDTKLYAPYILVYPFVDIPRLCTRFAVL